MKSGYFKRKLPVLFGIAIIVSIFSAAVMAQGTGENADGGISSDTEERNINKPASDGWRTEDYKPYIKSIKDLEKLSKDYSDSRLKMAKDEYSKGVDILDDMVADIAMTREQFKQKKYLSEKWYWQEIDRKNAQDRYVAGVKVTAKTKSVTYFTRAINLLDEINSNEIKSDPRYINFKVVLYRIYVSTQYDLGNLKPCIPILERYLELTDETRKDEWAYKYLSSCYAFMETILDNSRAAPDEEVAYYKNRKNQAILKAVELKYGRDSVEFKEMQKIVQKDERKTAVINSDR
ncbi:MAG TPA: hypothetical protein PK986_01250 [Spirochaetota bacterium]|nr:hypothetical protein [Spirochaetota bacterium]HQO39070.1 hypothetical protein [Spirochaetota bacterium]